MKRAFLQDGYIVDQVYVDRENLNLLAKWCEHLSQQASATKGDIVVLGEVPEELVLKYINDNGITFAEFMQNPEHQTRLLNHPDNVCFRVYKGRV